MFRFLNNRIDFEKGSISGMVKSRPYDAFAIVIMLAFALSIGAMLGQNNQSLGVATAAFIDSGSLLLSYHDMTSGGGFDQSDHYHSSIYGWPGNQITIWIIYALQVFSGGQIDIEQKAAIARLVSFSFSLLSILSLAYLSRTLNSSVIFFIAFVLFLVSYAPFVKFSYEIHPETAGLLFSTLSLVFCYKFVKSEGSQKHIFLAGFFVSLAVLSKQPFALYALLPVAVSFKDFKINDLGQSSLLVGKRGAILIGSAVLALFLAHPFAIIEFGDFYSSQMNIHSYHDSIGTPLFESVSQYAEIIWFKDQWVLIAMLSCLGLFVGMFGSDEEQGVKLFNLTIALILLATLALYAWKLNFHFFRSYLLPIIPAAFAVCSLYIQRHSQNLARIISTAFAAFLIVFSVYNLPWTISGLAKDFYFDGSAQLVLVNEVEQAGLGESRFVYSANLAFDEVKFSQSLNNFQFEYDETLLENLLQNRVEFVLLDADWPYSQTEHFSAAAENFNWETLKFSIDEPSRSNCSFQRSGTVSDCISDIRSIIDQDAQSSKRNFLVIGDAEKVNALRSIVIEN